MKTLLSVLVLHHLSKVDVLNSVTYRNRTLIFEWDVLGVWLQEHTPRWHMFKRNMTMCSEHVHYFRFNCQHNWGELI